MIYTYKVRKPNALEKQTLQKYKTTYACVLEVTACGASYLERVTRPVFFATRADLTRDLRLLDMIVQECDAEGIQNPSCLFQRFMEYRMTAIIGATSVKKAIRRLP